MPPPGSVLLVVLAITAAAAFGAAAARRARGARVAALAAGWQMRYTADDRFRLTTKVAANFPTPGVADVVLRDLVYAGEDGGAFRYLFTVEYTTGVLRTQRRRVGVAMVVEAAGQAVGPVVLAPAGLPILEQYARLREAK